MRTKEERPLLVDDREGESRLTRQSQCSFTSWSLLSGPAVWRNRAIACVASGMFMFSVGLSLLVIFSDDEPEVTRRADLNRQYVLKSCSSLFKGNETISDWQYKACDCTELRVAASNAVSNMTELAVECIGFLLQICKTYGHEFSELPDCAGGVVLTPAAGIGIGLILISIIAVCVGLCLNDVDNVVKESQYHDDEIPIYGALSF